MAEQKYKEVDGTVSFRGYDVTLSVRFFETGDQHEIDIGDIKIVKIVRESDHAEVHPRLFTSYWKKDAARRLAKQYT